MAFQRYAALETVKLLKELANEGCTVLCTIRCMLLQILASTEHLGKR